MCTEPSMLHPPHETLLYPPSHLGHSQLGKEPDHSPPFFSWHNVHSLVGSLQIRFLMVLLKMVLIVRGVSLPQMGKNPLRGGERIRACPRTGPPSLTPTTPFLIPFPLTTPPNIRLTCMMTTFPLLVNELVINSY